MDLLQRGNKIRYARKARKITQEDLAKLIGTSRVSVSNWEQGKTEIDLLNALSLSIELDLPIDDLVDDIPVGFRRRYLQEPGPDYLQPDEVSSEAADLAYMWDRIDEANPIKDLIYKTVLGVFDGKPPARHK